MSARREVHNPVTGERYVALARGADTGGAYVEGRGYLPVGARPPGMHRHPHRDERVTVVSGRIRARIGREEREVGPGETVELPHGVCTTSGWWETPGRDRGPGHSSARHRAAPRHAGRVGHRRQERPQGPPAAAARGGHRAVLLGGCHFKTPPVAVQRLLLPALPAVGRRRGLRPYYERHFQPGEIEAVLSHWAANRPWAGNQRPEP